MKKLSFPVTKHSTAIILNGERNLILAKHLKHYSHLIITDGAWDDLRQLIEPLEGNGHINPQKITVLGDGDSISEAPNNFVYQLDQNTTDFEKALLYAIEQHKKTADIWWADGGEADHFLGNLAIANQYSSQITLHFSNTKQSYFLVNNRQEEEFSLLQVKGRTISLFPFPQAFISAEGLLYPLHKLTLNQHQQQSLRNHAVEDTVTLSIKGTVWIFVSENKKSTYKT